MQAKMAKALKTRASKQTYISSSQPFIEGFETPFSRKLNPLNRWVVLAHKIPWDNLVSVYRKQMGNHQTGADGINPRVVIGSLIIKHIAALTDRETVQQISENMYMQYFIGYSSFSDEVPFDSSLFVEFRNRLGLDQVNAMNEIILKLSVEKNQPTKEDIKKEVPPKDDGNLPTIEKQTTACSDTSLPDQQGEVKEVIGPTHEGQMIIDATACPQDIRYPTDLNLLNDARKKSEELIDYLHGLSPQEVKPRTYREEARKYFLKTIQKKTKSKKEIRKAIKKQLAYLNRNIKSINRLLDGHEQIPFDAHQHKYFFVIQTFYEQQAQMHNQRTHAIEYRIVSIHQPHVRPIVRGKTNANVEFGAKIQVSLMNGYAFLEDLSWEAFNEGARLMKAIEQYKQRLGYYPKEVLADKIYCSRANRASLKELGIRLKAKPLGRPKAMAENHVSPGERNPIEGKFGQAKSAYGLNRIKARLQGTSESWIATIIMVLNLVRLTREVPYCIYHKWLSFSARYNEKVNTWVNRWSGQNQGEPNGNLFYFYLFSRP